MASSISIFLLLLRILMRTLNTLVKTTRLFPSYAVQPPSVNNPHVRVLALIGVRYTCCSCSLPLSASCIWLDGCSRCGCPSTCVPALHPAKRATSTSVPHRSLPSSERLRSLFMHDSFICYIYSFTLSKHPVAGILLSVQRAEHGTDVIVILVRYPSVEHFVRFSGSPYRHSTVYLMGPGDSFLVSKAAET